jgi:hypothetical protein
VKVKEERSANIASPAPNQHAVKLSFARRFLFIIYRFESFVRV